MPYHKLRAPHPQAGPWDRTCPSAKSSRDRAAQRVSVNLQCYGTRSAIAEADTEQKNHSLVIQSFSRHHQNVTFLMSQGFLSSLPE